MNDFNPNLMMDFYEFTMAYTYFKEGKHLQYAYFDMFIRSVPNQGGYVVFNGLHRFIEFVQGFKINEQQIAYLRKVGNFSEDFLEYLCNLKLELDVWAVPEGTIVFPNEPFITVRGNWISAQIVETVLLLCVNYASLVTTKASRVVFAAKDKGVLEFGARRAQGFDAAIQGARGAVIAGCIGTSNTLAGAIYDLTVSGTMAHSFIQLYPDEYSAFLAYAKVQPSNCIFLIDTYDSLNSGIVNAVRVAKEFLIPNGYTLKGVRLDSGDLAYLAKKIRVILNDNGLIDTKIVVSNSLDEYLIEGLLNQNAPIDIFGVGENLITSASAPVLGGVYKVVASEVDGVIEPKIKLSDNNQKITNPGYKKVYRFYDLDNGKALADVVALANEVIDPISYELFDPNSPWKKKTISNYQVLELQQMIFSKGNLVYQVPTTSQVIAYHRLQLNSFWEEVLRLRNPHKYYVDLSLDLYNLKQILMEKYHQIVGE